MVTTNATIFLQTTLADCSRKPTHYQALRTLANRLVGILQGCLRTHTLYKRAPRLAQQLDKLSPAA